MRRIVTAITAASLALSLTALALPAPAAAAVTGFDSSYAGESAFLTLAPGASGTFTVFFANTGTTTWAKGTSTQVDLAACLEDKVTCNAQDASEASFNPATGGWLSATRYATTTQTSVAPGQIGTFTYNVQVPADGTGLHHFNGAVVLASSGADIHNEGYFQDVSVAAPSGAAATLVSLSPTTGTTAGGTTVTATGSGFVCTPSFPTVTVDTTAVTPTACGSTSLTFTTPAHAAGGVNVTVTNAGAPASNALLFTFKAPAPSFTSLGAFSGGTIISLNFDQKVCTNAALAAGGADVAVTVNGISANPTAFSPSGVTCDAGSGVAAGPNASLSTAIRASLPVTLVAGDFVAATLTVAGAAKIQNADGTLANGPQTQTATAAPNTTKPQMTSAIAKSTTTIKASYNQADLVNDCAGTNAAAAAQFVATIGSSSFTGSSVTCPSSPFGSTSLTVTFAASTAGNPATVDVSAGGFITYTASAGHEVVAANAPTLKAVTPQTIAVSAIAVVSTTRPTITAVTRTPKSSSTTLSDGDKFVITFSTAMDTTLTPATLTATAPDPGLSGSGAANDTINISCFRDTCTFNAAATSLTIVIATAALDCTAAGGAAAIAGCQLPETIIDSSNFKDTNGNVLDLSNKPQLPQ